MESANQLFSDYRSLIQNSDSRKGRPVSKLRTRRRTKPAQ
jgi:hypothetical protein